MGRGNTKRVLRVRPPVIRRRRIGILDTRYQILDTSQVLSQMLPKHQKLSRTSFPLRGDRKTTWAGGAIRVNVYRDAEGILPRFAVVVPKNKSTGAVSRNSFKRSVMEAIRGHMGGFERFPHRKYVFFPNEHLRAIVREQIKKDVESFLASMQ